ncbi:MAG: alkaline phosphatase D family protein [Sphingomonas sp.]|uniref:alkaline phosphatase D family protein n=1 Tax=Sphingomonas sp. TaxID=28214 RepID=UPI001B231FA9|nr:alkaline phosphatase D family protein [Sphingomonas sp.]MBO9621848.1 alkaline phosphatase D family protein [Sphingomonas sp.]
MTLTTDRRSLLLTGTLGLGALAIPGFALAQGLARGFTHSVASGEPQQQSMLLWTRYVPADGGAARLRVELSETQDFARVVTGGETITGPWRDHTAKITVTGLEPGTRYFYRFVGPDGTFSPVGRTRTLPRDDARRVGIAIFSCSNLPFGYFNAYAHAAQRDDIDLWIHLGDYLYEYKKGGYAPAAGAVGGRWPEPEGEMIQLADYRLRYASYRSDPDLQALHAAKPMLIQWDDHESANNSWEGGAENHQPDEGDWNARRAAAIQVFREWMPVSDDPWASYELGTLATFFRTESRLLGRTQAPDIAPLFQQADPAAALKAFRDGPWQDPAATMLGSAQEAWLAQGLARSVRAGQRWQLVGFGTIMGEMRTPADALGWLAPDASAKTRAYVAAAVAAAKAGLPNEMDNWGGYPAARARFLKSAQAAGANLLVIAGDSHNAWAFDLAQDGKPAGVEFAGHSVTSPGYENSLAIDPKRVAAAMVGASRELKWCDTSRRGYMALTLTPDRATNDWVFLDTIVERSTRATVGHSATVARGRNLMA